MWAPYGRCVQWLRQRIERVFGLPNSIALMIRGHLLPMSEPLLMLEPDETIQVVTMFSQPDKLHDPNVTSHRSINDINALTGHPGANLKRPSTQSSASTKQENLSQSLRSKQGNNIEEHQDMAKYNQDKTLNNFTEDMEMGSVESQSLDANDDLQRVKQQALRLLDEHYLAQGASAPKRVRRRRRRRQPALETTLPSASDQEEPQNCDTTDRSQDVSAAILRNGSGSRPPRLIHALSPSSVSQET